MQTRRVFSLLGRWLARALIRLGVAALLSLACALVYLMVPGLSGPSLHRLLQKYGPPDFSVEAARLHLDVLEGVVLDDVKVYRKRTLGLPVIEARELSVRTGLDGLLGRGVRLRRVTVRHGFFRPEHLSGPPAVATVPPRAPSSFALETRLDLEDCEVRDIHVRDGTCRLRVIAPVVRFDDILADIAADGRAGRCTGSLMIDASARIADVRVSTGFDPRLLRPLLRAHRVPFLGTFFDWFQYDERPPACDVQFTWEWGAAPVFHLQGRAAMDNVRYRGVPVLHAEGGVDVDVSPSNVLVRVDPLVVERPEGSARGTLSVEPRRDLVLFDAASTMDPRALFGMVGILGGFITNTFRFRGGVEATGRGQVDYRDLSDTSFSVDILGRDFSVRQFDVEQCSARMTMSGTTNRLEDIQGRAYGGTVAGRMEFVVPIGGDTSRVPYRVEATFEKVDFEKLAVALRPGAPAKDYSGRLSGRLNVAGVSGAGGGATVRGDGEVRIEKGRVFMLPLFGGLSRFMTRVIPGLDFVLRQTDANASFSIADSRLQFEKVAIEGDVLSLTGRGSYRFNGDLDCYAQVTLMKDNNLVAKLVRLVTYPLSKLFEFRLRGSVSSPVWYPTNFSPDLLRRIGLLGRAENGTAAPVPEGAVAP